MLKRGRTSSKATDIKKEAEATEEPAGNSLPLTVTLITIHISTFAGKKKAKFLESNS